MELLADENKYLIDKSANGISLSYFAAFRGPQMQLLNFYDSFITYKKKHPKRSVRWIEDNHCLCAIK